ncbi:hypothetical protein BMON_1388 [Bifidobacterium mongoliense DSM 21395]|uniref:Uncharacterized protein n=1 Tax=Bifidobacterium mongoliense DSM 21395 TaxID=1437603 RepID=A0A087BSZ2_9BIFI|nr:hypothetical protein BMON_1388 [Bifidobacterium mongoliense DSM 21395]
MTTTRMALKKTSETMISEKVWMDSWCSAPCPWAAHSECSSGLDSPGSDAP